MNVSLRGGSGPAGGFAGLIWAVDLEYPDKNIDVGLQG